MKRAVLAGTIFSHLSRQSRLIVRVNRKEYTVGFKVVLLLKVVVLLIVSAALAVSIEFPSFVLSHPRYSSSVHTTVEDLKRYSATALVDEQIARVLAVKPGDYSESKALSESVARSAFANTNPFPDLLPPDAKFPPFELTHPDTGPVDVQSQDSGSRSTSSSSLSDFYLKSQFK